ncbi:unnamed protein product [Owenia fusiformis]|uniref:Uncharacterized protein n=1 Tax=Owenia fusiformis TaxID=6347 RepID=A0A8J1Y544_OWEFU|nr:unnamed protein product [Owenia fusiformis]
MAKELYKLKSGEQAKYDDMDFDELLAQLTEEDIEALNDDFDPDDSLLPPDQRCKDQTKKAPTGKFDRKALLDFIEKKSREDPDWEQNKPFVHEIRGKIWTPKEPEKKPKSEDPDDIETEFDEILEHATEEELVDLAAVLGFHGMLNQVQYHQSMDDNKITDGFRGIARSADLKLVPNEPPNNTDVEESLEQIKSNDSKLEELNLNNIKNISIERLLEFAEALKSNTNLVKFHMANTRANDKVAKALSEALESNKTLQVLNVESNFISPAAQVNLLTAVNENQTIIEVRMANQKPSVLGVKTEMAIAKLMEENQNIEALGMHFQIPSARVRVTESIQRNIDNKRKNRKENGSGGGDA